MQQLDNLLEQFRGVWRFRRTGQVVAWSVLLLSLLVITLLPDRYEASATVFVDTQTALGAATRNLTVDSNVDSQIERVREALLGAPQLAKIADEIGLTAHAATPRERQKVVDKLRQQIKIAVGVAQPAGGGTYVISYPNKVRETSLKVVEKLVRTFVEETLGGKREGSEQAQQFLVQQIAELEKRLSKSEEELAAFKKEHVGLLPGSQDDYFARLETETAQLDKSQTALTVASMRRSEIQRQLHGEQPLLPGAAEKAGAGSGAPAGAGGDTATRLRQSQQQLDELLLSYTEKHPKVIALRNSVKELEKRLADEMEAARRGDTGAAARTGLAASPVYQNLQVQYNEAGVEIAALQADIANRRQRVASLRSMMNTAPEVEAQFSRLNRDYNVIKAQYTALVDQLGRARLGEQAAQTGIVGFHLIDPARAGFDPVFPKRPLLALAAFAAAILIGIGVAFILDQLRPVYSSARRLQELTGLPVLGEVSMTRIDWHGAQTRKSVLRLAGSVMGMLVVVGVFLLAQRQLVSALKSWTI